MCVCAYVNSDVASVSFMNMYKWKNMDKVLQAKCNSRFITRFDTHSPYCTKCVEV